MSSSRSSFSSEFLNFADACKADVISHLPPVIRNESERKTAQLISKALVISRHNRWRSERESDEEGAGLNCSRLKALFATFPSGCQLTKDMPCYDNGCQCHKSASWNQISR